MGRQSAAQLDVEHFRSELLGRLGLAGSAGDGDIERAYGSVTDYLEQAPAEITDWAANRTTEADEAFVLLSGPPERLAAAATAGAGPAGAPPAAVTPEPVVTRAAVLAAFRPRGRAWLLIAPVLLAAVVFGVYHWGGGSSVPGVTGTPTNTASPAASDKAPALDTAKVSALMKKISANPKDVTALSGLGEAYFQAGDYKTTALWENKVLALEPKNKDALLALGAALFNQGDSAGAEKQWTLAANLYPNLAEVHYDLGFLYLSQDKPDLAKVRAEWNKVVEIDPTSAVAKTVATHLKSLDEKAGPSAAPSAAADPAAGNR